MVCRYIVFLKKVTGFLSVKKLVVEDTSLDTVFIPDTILLIPQVHY